MAGNPPEDRAGDTFRQSNVDFSPWRLHYTVNIEGEDGPERIYRDFPSKAHAEEHIEKFEHHFRRIRSSKGMSPEDIQSHLKGMDWQIEKRTRGN